MLPPFARWAQRAGEDQAFLRQMNPDQTCEFLAGAWDLDGWDTQLSEPNKAGYRKIHAHKQGFGSIFVIDQPLVLPDNRFVSPADLRPLLPELDRGPKAFVSTTSTFEEGLSELPDFAPLIRSGRLELRDGETILSLVRDLRESGKLGGLSEMDASTPRGFFDRYIVPALGDWTKNPDDKRLATTLAGALNNSIDRLCAHDKGPTPKKTDLLALRDQLAAKCPEFGLIRDIADTEKHVQLTRRTRRVSKLDQTQTSGAFGTGFDAAGFDVVRIVVVEDDGTVHEFADIVPAAVTCIENELAARGL